MNAPFETTDGPPILDIPTVLEGLSGEGTRPALTFYRGKTLEGRLRYDELVTKTNAVAGALHDRFGIRQGDRVAILAPNRLEIPVVVLALMRLGAVVVPLNPGAAVDDWLYILRHCGARALCATRDLEAKVPEGSRAPCIPVEDVFALGDATPPAVGDLHDAPAVILYTSGTTGRPKGVALRQRSLVANAWSMAQNFGLDHTTQLAVLPLYHAHAFGFGLMSALSTGGHLVFAERMEPFAWAGVVRSENVEVSSVVPTLLPMLLAAGVTHDKVPTLRCLMVSSAPLPGDLARDFMSRTRIPLILGWGLSEYTNFACCVPPSATSEERDRLMFGWEVPSIGPALRGTEVRVVAASGEPVAEGTRGELVVSGHSTMIGYFEDPEQTAACIDAGGWLHTGDEGFWRTWRDRPVFFITGRLKEIIIRDAEKFSPLNLERRLVEALPELSGKLVVLGFPHEGHGEEVGAYVETDAVDDALRARLLSAVQVLPVPERPKVILHGAEPIPRTHTGKVQRRRMQPWFAAWRHHKGAVVVARHAPLGAVSS